MTDTQAGIARVSRWLEWLAFGGLIGLGVLLGVLVVLPTLFQSLLISLAPERAPETLSIAQHIVAILVAVLAVAPALYVLWQLRRLFQLFGAGEVFTQRAASLLRYVGWGCVAAAASSTLAKTLAILTVTWTNPPGERALAISLDGGTYSAVLFGALLIVLGWVQGEAARIAAENREIV